MEKEGAILLQEIKGLRSALGEWHPRLRNIDPNVRNTLRFLLDQEALRIVREGGDALLTRDEDFVEIPPEGGPARQLADKDDLPTWPEAVR